MICEYCLRRKQSPDIYISLPRNVVSVNGEGVFSWNVFGVINWSIVMIVRIRIYRYFPICV